MEGLASREREKEGASWCVNIVSFRDHKDMDFSPMSLCAPTCFPMFMSSLCQQQADCGGPAGCSHKVWEKAVSWGTVSSPTPDFSML